MDGRGFAAALCRTANGGPALAVLRIKSLMERSLTAITVHKIPDKEICGVVILEQQPDGAWAGKCSKCDKPFYREPDPTFERQVLAIRN